MWGFFFVKGDGNGVVVRIRLGRVFKSILVIVWYIVIFNEREGKRERKGGREGVVG